MEFSTNIAEVTHDFPPFFKVYQGGRIERHMVTTYVPPGVDEDTGVQSKDVLISSKTAVKGRVFLPRMDGSGRKLPLVVHYHGGGFCGGSSFDDVSKRFLTSMADQARAIFLSVDYRLAPEHPLPTGYEDSWGGLQWVGSHSGALGPEPWLNMHVDFNRVFLAGESAGANIAHHVAIRAGVAGLPGLKIAGLVLVHPFFGGKEEDKMYKYLCPTSSGGDDDPNLNPSVDPNLAKMGCEKVLICVAEKDWLRDRGEAYSKILIDCGWGGKVELFETAAEEHCFHLFKENSKKQDLLKKIADFVSDF